MAHIHTESLEWHEGEKFMHSLLHVPENDNPTTLGLSPYGSSIAMRSSLLALGTLDKAGRPWTTLLGGEPAFTRPLGRSIIGVKTLVDRKYDPVLEILTNEEQDRQSSEQEPDGLPISGLPIDLVNRNRLKISGRLIASALNELDSDVHEGTSGVGEVQLLLKIDRSLGIIRLDGLNTS